MNFPIKVIIAFSCLLFIYGCSKEKETPETGEELFKYYCSPCHGEGASGQFLRGVPPLIKNKALRPVPLTPGQIRHKIQENLDPESKMPNFQNLTDREARLISDYIMTLSK